MNFVLDIYYMSINNIFTDVLGMKLHCKICSSSKRHVIAEDMISQISNEPIFMKCIVISDEICKNKSTIFGMDFGNELKSKNAR